ncbi:uncharacterized protein LOC131310389 [Rhododendron vialii]|uniref:uncharacterized protein LOC131310389 n=1 Tax=Rhododendron vialii TaxID=182163 RepID=UPI00265EE9E1|nr:uncharacterized protein LOC131310389 [Rhododendron vialii]
MARRAWTEAEEEKLLDNITSLVDAGVWQGEHGGMIPASFEVLQHQMTAAFLQGGFTKNIIEGKIKKWKETYFTIEDMMLTPGFGWNPNENRLVVDNEDWNEFVRVNPRARQMRGMQFSHFNRWAHCFRRH